LFWPRKHLYSDLASGFLLEVGQSHGVSGAGGINTRAARFFRLSLLVLAWEQDRSCATVCFGDDPKLLALSGLVVAQQSETLLK
jgi:hypothetical protein